MQKKLELLQILADGDFHSGERLGELMGMSRTAVWKHIQGLQELGIECHSVAGKGYRLSESLELLDSKSITANLCELSSSLLSQLELHPQIDSTNRHLMGAVGQGMESGHVCIAESQTDGRGRRGRAWVSPFAKNIYMSCYWQFDISPAMLSGLGLAVAVGVVRALNELGINGAQLKWPNDILWQGRKLAGILLEMSAESGGPYHVVIGVGLNVNMGKSVEEIGQPWVDLQSVMGSPLSRNAVAAALLRNLLCTAREFEEGGLAAFVDAWGEYDAYAQQPVVIHQADASIEGIAKGIDSEGAILIETPDGLRRFYSGDVSLRPLKVAE